MVTISDNPTIGWVGTGRMGQAMAGRLLDAGRDLSVWNRTRSKTAPLAERGARVVEGIADLADRDVVFITVAASDDLLQVLSGPGGLLTGGSAPQVVIDSSTVSQSASARARELAVEGGAEFLAAPVSGNPKAIVAGKMVFVVSGSEGTVDAVRPVMGDIGRAVHYVGEGEVARLVKACHNLYLGLVTQALAEVTILAQKGGAPRAGFLGFLNDSPMGSVFSRYKAPAMVNLDFHPTFTTVLLRKDFDIGLDTARRLEVPMPITAEVHQIIQSAIGRGYGEEDFAALIRLQAAGAGIELESENVEVDDGL